MKGLVVCDTSDGNLEKIRETVVETFRQSGINVDVFDVKDIK